MGDMQAVVQVCSVSKTADAAQKGTFTLLRGKELSCHLSPAISSQKGRPAADEKQSMVTVPAAPHAQRERKVTPTGARSGGLAASLQRREAQQAGVLREREA